MSAARCIGDLIAEDVFRTLGISQEYFAPWKDALVVSAWMHDWGKGNEQFQSMIRGDLNIRQSVRHEAVTLYLAGYFLREALNPLWKNYPRWFRTATLCAIGGHHLKFPDQGLEHRPATPVNVLLGHQEMKELLSKGRSFGFDDSRLDDLQDMSVEVLSSDALPTYIRRFSREIGTEFSREEKALIAATKTGLLAADLAGSALPGKAVDLSRWIEERLCRILQPIDLQNVVLDRLRGQAPRTFQQKVADSDDRLTLVEAGCGSGKTVAAYLWAARHAQNRRLFFCYPTTATASEGFSGYLPDPDFDALLVHGRSVIDYRLLPNIPEMGNEEKDILANRLEALDMWPVPAVVCTAHTVLGLLQNVRRGLYAWPSLVRAAYVFDEVHAFDDTLFAHLLRFLTEFPGAPVLVMTATLPPEKRQMLQKIAQTRGGGICCISGPPERESAPRYRLEDCGEKFDLAWQKIADVLRGGGKVLWVCNTVNRAIAISERAEQQGMPVELYHSRFRYRDRLQRQRSVIDGFHASVPMLAVTTQVAEMSLDLSADLLVSEYAPVPSLIQRLGRLNRSEEIPRETKPGLFFKPESYLPYDEADMDKTLMWIKSVANGSPVSQADLQVSYSALSPGYTVDPAPYSDWFDGLTRSLRNQHSITEGSSSVEVVRFEDRQQRFPAEYAIPMPMPHDKDWADWERVGRYLIAPINSITYDERRGAKWVR